MPIDSGCDREARTENESVRSPDSLSQREAESTRGKLHWSVPVLL